MDDGELQFLEEEDFVSFSGTSDQDASTNLGVEGTVTGMSRSYEGRRKISRPIYVEGGETVTGSQSLDTRKHLVISRNSNAERNTMGVKHENRYIPDDEAAAKFESLSKAVLIEVAVSQEAMIKRLQQSLRKEKEKSQAVDKEMLMLKSRLGKLENVIRVNHVKNIDLLATLDTTIQDLDEKISRAERQVSRVQTSLADSMKNDDKVKEVTTETETRDVGIQCERPRTSLEWIELSSNDALRINSDAPTSLDSPIIEHLIQCWASATNRCAVGVVQGNHDNSGNINARDTPGTGSDVEYSCGRIPLLESKQLLKQWINNVTTMYQNLESEKDSDSLDHVQEASEEKTKAGGTCVAELNNLPKEIYDGFCIHLVPFLQGCGVQVKTYHRPRDVYDLKVTIMPLKSFLPSKFVPDPGCIMCRDIYFYARNEDVNVMDEW
eukprot:CAMPEP_0204823978 /NCGR_PEP_ID=MMETSP1346-20131115/2044_1 /ASSEMBLY_ACC=CAM_ASM_000771 /TAXON_ID=215587 /ORGANISM="Aplanochytrium stocchinoi, Strain GSBS06" /LENGTH=436 /DNA_ID=CAMNT_0051950889 /DNA_START=172 /DNA_END=1479 /DNA_ORIENTATION=+